MKRLCAVLLVCLMGAAAYAGFADTPHVAGSLQGWDPGANPMTETASGSGIWEATFTGLNANERHEFKITQGNWDDTFPGPNSWLYTDSSGEVTITFNTNVVSDGWDPTQYRLGLSTDPGAWTIAGSFGGAEDWNNAAPTMAMTDQGGGIYKLTKSLTAGTYYWKSVVTSSWDSISWDNRSVNTANIELVLAADADVNFYVDALSGTVKSEIIPEPATLLLLGLGSLVAIRRRK